MDITAKDKVTASIRSYFEDSLFPGEEQFIADFFSAKNKLELKDEDKFRLEVLNFTLFDSDYQKYIPMTGIHIAGGTLIRAESKDDNYMIDFSCKQLDRQIKITGSNITAGIDLSYCTLKSLILESCKLPFIKLDGSTLKGNLYIKKCKFFDHARSSVHAENMIVEGSISFIESAFISGVHLRGARIDANADFSDALCISQEVATTRLWSSPAGMDLIEKVTESIAPEKKSIECETITKRLKTITERLKNERDSVNKFVGIEPKYVSKAPLQNTKLYAVCLQQAFVGGSIIFGKDKYKDNSFLAVGEVTLNNCRTNGSVLCSGGSFFHPGPKTERDTAVALCLDALDARLSIFLDDGFLAHGTVSLRGAQTQQRLVCKEAIFVKAVTKERATEERDDYALFAKRISVQGDVMIYGEKQSDPAIWGRISFENGKIGGGLHLCAQEAKPQSTMPHTINLRLSRIRDKLRLIIAESDVQSNELNKCNPNIDLSFAEIGLLSIAIPEKSKTEWRLNGISYRDIEFVSCEIDTQINFDRWLKILNTQDAIQPYDPFIAYLKTAGLETHVNDACFSKEDHIVKNLWCALCTEFCTGLRKRFSTDKDNNEDNNEGKLKLKKIGTFLELCIRTFIVRPLVGYGYNWGRGVVFLILLILFGGMVFSFAHNQKSVFASRAHIYGGDFSPAGAPTTVPKTAPTDYPDFQPLLFSLDAAIPGLDIGQERHWEIMGGTWFECYFYFHFISGWLLSFLLVLSPTKLLHRE